MIEICITFRTQDPKLCELWVYSLVWVMQDFYHQTLNRKPLNPKP